MTELIAMEAKPGEAKPGVPCSKCGTTGGRRKNKHSLNQPFRYSGGPFGFPGKLCDTCYTKERRLKQNGGVPKVRPAKRTLKPRVLSQHGTGIGWRDEYIPTPEMLARRCKAVRLLVGDLVTPEQCEDKRETRRAVFAKLARAERLMAGQRRGMA